MYDHLRQASVANTLHDFCLDLAPSGCSHFTIDDLRVFLSELGCSDLPCAVVWLDIRRRVEQELTALIKVKREKKIKIEVKSEQPTMDESQKRNGERRIEECFETNALEALWLSPRFNLSEFRMVDV